MNRNLEFRPEKARDLKARFSRALKPMDDPDSERDHIFEYEDGMRLVVSLEDFHASSERPWIQLSVSAVPSTEAFSRYYESCGCDDGTHLRVRVDEIASEACLRFGALSGYRGCAHLVEVERGLVPFIAVLEESWLHYGMPPW